MEWISVEDRLPDRAGDILSYHSDWGVQLSHYNGGSDFISTGLYYTEATHWMPLPEPPKESNNE